MAIISMYLSGSILYHHVDNILNFIAKKFSELKAVISVMEKPIKVLAITDYLGRKNLNPVRPESAQILGMQQTGLVDISILCSPESVLVDYYRGRLVGRYINNLRIGRHNLDDFFLHYDDLLFICL